MKIFWFFIVFSLIGCQHKSTTRVQTPTPSVDPNSNPTGKPSIDLQQLKVNLTLEEYQNGNASGVLFKPTLDSKARYLGYIICSVDKPTLCVDGKLDGLLPDVIYDVPNGNVKVQYFACVFPEETKSSSFCGPKKTFTYEHAGENTPPLQLALVASQDLSHNIRDFALDTRAFLQQYRTLEKVDQRRLSLNYFDTLVLNQVEMNTFVLGRIYDSPLMKSYTTKMNQLINERAKHLNSVSNGIAIFLMGNNKVFDALLNQLKNAYSSPVTNQELDAASSDALSNALDVFLRNFDDQATRHSLLEKLGLVMNGILQSKSDRETYNK